MTQPYPQQPGFPPGPPQYAAQQPQQYAPPQPGYQQPQQYGQQPAAPQYAQQPQQYGYPQNQGSYPVAQPQQQYAPAPQVPAGSASLDGYYSQPSAGWGPAWQLGLKIQDGTSYIGVVAQWITKAHLEYATQKNPITQQEEVSRFKNGDPKVNMKVPMNMVPDQRYTEGRGQLYVGPGEKDGLSAAIATGGGDPSQPPPLGSMIRATKTGSRPNSFGGQSATRTFEYWLPEVAQGFAQQLGIPYPDLNTPRPVDEGPKHAAPEASTGGDGNGGNFTPAPASAGPAVQQQAAPPQPVAQQLPPPPVAQAPPQAPAGPPMGMPTAPAQQVQQPAPMAGPPAMGQVPNDPAKAELLARLTGQAPQPAA